MAEDELDHLLEAFAADRLTPEERRQLHAAAMRDQRLLCALADEQALKEVLRDPALRARLLLELRTPGRAWRTETRWLRPWMWITAGSALLLVITILIGTELYQDRIPEQPPSVKGEDSGPTLPAVAAPSPESDPVTPGPEDVAVSPPAVLNEPNTDRPTARRIPAPFTGPMIEERVVDDEINVPSTVLRKQEPERPTLKKPESRSRSKTKPPAVAEPEPPAPQTAHDDALAPPPEESASPALQQAALPTPSAQRTPAPHFSSARTLFYGQHKQAASAAAVPSDESDQSSGSETEREPLVPSALAAPLAIRYSLVMAGQDGTNHEVDPETPVSLSDRPRLAVQANQDGYLLVSEVPSTSETAISPPTAAKPVRARTTVTFPLAGLITDPEANPVLRLRLTFTSRRPNSKHLLSQTPGVPLEERVAPAPGGPAEHAVYVAAPGGARNPMLIVDFDLNQRP